MIILTVEEANAVRGPTSPGSFLLPAPLIDGTFALPEAVLSDPAHAMHRDFLWDKPIRDVWPDEWVWDVGTEEDI